jgi:6-pyruvoyltetrahydropterin/6-carboxytetrahydropterin synthase
VIERLDHTDLNDVMPHPSAENIAVWTWKALEDLPLAEIRVQETPSCWVTYAGPGAEPPPAPARA